MTIYKRELAFKAENPGGHTGEWWHLILDANDPGLWVEHTRIHQNAHTNGAEQQSEQRFGINDFLTLAEGQEARAALLVALTEMFKDGGRDH